MYGMRVVEVVQVMLPLVMVVVELEEVVEVIDIILILCRVMVSHIQVVVAEELVGVQFKHLMIIQVKVVLV